MKKLLIFLGAGGSIDFGMPSVNDIDKLFINWSSNYHYWWTKGKSNSPYSWAKELLIQHNSLTAKDSVSPELNFEDILFQMQSINSFFSEGNPTSKFSNRESLPELTNYLGLKGKATGEDFFKNSAFLSDDLLKHIRSLCLDLPKTKNVQLKKLENFIYLLKQKFDIGVINLNYDNVLLTADPDLKTGFDKKGKFDLNQIYSTEWNFCYHIHGSIHFDFSNNDQVIWKNDLSSKFGYGSANYAPIKTEEGNHYRKSGIILGKDKINQLNREPFKYYFAKLGKLIYESDAILYIGYGFNDKYLNRILFSHLKMSQKNRNIIAIDLKDDNYPSLAAAGTNLWGYRLLTSNYKAHYEMGNGDPNYYMPETVKHYKTQKSFEFSNTSKPSLKVWYNGLITALDDPEFIIENLK